MRDPRAALMVESLRAADQVILDEASSMDQERDDVQAADPSSQSGPGDSTDRQAILPEAASERKTVLVVEDDEAVSSLLVALLEDRGYNAVPAFDGRSAIELARKLMPHLITLDLALPGSDGHEVLASLKSDARTREIPIVVISAFTQILPAGDRKKLAYLLGKPFDVTEVLDIVQATVGNPYL